jgi:hypothetical protein
MDTNWAGEHLQVIRTLMERSVLYRRALAPIMMVNGLIGIAAAAGGYFGKIEAGRAFSIYWICISLVALTATFLLVRREALKESEPFWSPPTRRITTALMPTFFAGLLLAGLFIFGPWSSPDMADLTWLLAACWTALYGFALHSAGFFMQRGIKLLAWAFILGGCAIPYIYFFVILKFNTDPTPTDASGHIIMGLFFGLVHLAYSIYLYFTEKQNRTA